MPKKNITMSKKSTRDVDEPVKGSRAELLALVWPLTAEVAALGGYDVEQRLQRNVVRLMRRKS